MEKQFWDVLATHPFFVVVVIFGGIFAVAALLIAIDHIHTKLGFKTKAELDREERKRQDEIRDKQRQDIWSEIVAMRDEFRDGFKRNDEQFTELEKQMSDLRQSNISILGDRITQKTKYYLKTGFIPAEEMTEYRALFDLYKKLGGNHGVDDLVEKTINILPLKSQEG